MCAGKNKLAISLALVAFILLSTTPLAAQESRGSANGDWAALKTVSIGSKLAVKLKNGKSLDGKVISVSETSLTLSGKDKPVELKREDVLSVGVIVLDGKFQSDIVLAGFKVDGWVVQNLFVLVQMFDKF